MQQVQQCMFGNMVKAGCLRQCLKNTDVANVNMRPGNAGSGQRRVKQTNDFQISLNAGITEQLGAKLDNLTTGCLRCRQGMQDTAAITQPGHALPVKQMRIDTRHLRCHIGAQSQCTPGKLIDELESAQTEIGPRAGQQ